MIDLCQWRARIGSWNCSCHWAQPSACTSTSNTYCGTGRASAGDTAQEKGPRLFLPIFCLLILLFISGDVELNPGPTLTDKPTKDQLVELLSSSKFTAGTWEQFVCYLPNMTQDIITGIKERGSIEDTMSAVAQHCLDNNPDITWKRVINALLDANEAAVARNALDEHSGTSSSKNVCRTVKQVLRSHYSKLMETTETCLLKVASELYSKNLINKEVRHSPTFEKIEIDFLAMVSLYKGDAKKMMEVCSLFIECLSTAGGPAQEEAIALARDWENEVFKDHQISFSTFTKAAIEYTPQEVKLSYNDSLAVELRNLSKKYVILLDDITAYYASSGKHEAIDLARWVQNTFYETGLARVGVTVDEIFERMLPHHSYIDIDAINDLMEANPIDDSVLQARFDEYSDNIDKFINSVELNDIVKTIEAAIIGESTKVDPKVILKLSGRWNEQTIGHVRKLMKYLFNEEAKYVTIKKFLRGSISIQFFIVSNVSVQPLIAKSRTKIPFLHLLGIFQLIIDNQTIIDREEDINFNFEESLLQSIASVKSSLEYQRLYLLLMELKIELNYQNTNGQTPLTLASKGGHIEIFKSLLQSGANPFVQLPANKGFIGLNYLACTALSQHIYKSIGGEKIIPRDDTSVEEMLEMAVKERGVSGHFYEPFIIVVKTKIKEKFQWLQDCFHALDCSFLDTATNILTSKGLVTEAKQKFQSYIKEDATCEDAHQLVQLLQPHYSCLNINLLTIPCTITEPIKEQVEEYNTNLKMFKDTTSLLELAMMTRGMQCPDGVSCSKLIVRLNKPWCSRTITELNKMENFHLLVSTFLTLLKIHHGASSLTCTYLLPQLNSQTLAEAVFEHRVSLYKIGVFEVMIDDIPIMMEEEDKSFTFEAALQKALQNNDENVLFFLLFLLQLNISLPLENGSTVLILACQKGDFLTVHFLLSKDPDINIQDNDGVTALIAASSNGHHQVVELLLNKNPDINIQNNDGVTALMFASANGHHQVVELLLSKDPDINIQRKDGWTALMAASANRHHQVVELLLNKDPDINIQNNDKLTALMYASNYGHHQVVELLLSKDPDINIQSNSGGTALMFASNYGHHQVVELLLSNDPDINSQNKDGVTALIFASGNGHHQVVKLLLSKDPSINIQNNNRSTALMFASGNGHHQVIELLLSKDPDINIQNNNGWTALMAASGNSHHQVVELLLSRDPDIDIQNNNGWTALMLASSNGHHQVVELLLSKDPNINIQNNDGVNALMIASYNGHHQVVELLLSKDPDINIQDNYGRTALMASSYFGHHQVVDLLLSKNPDVDIQNNDKRTALMFASHNGHHQVVELLLSKDPDVNIQDNDGRTALMLASVDGHHQVVELLLSKDPDINIQDKNGYNALTPILAFLSNFILTKVLTTDDDASLDNHTRLLVNQLHSGNYITILKLLLDNHPHHIHTFGGKKLHSLSLAALSNNFDAVTVLMEKCDITPEHIISAFTAALYGGHSSMIIHMSEKITTLSSDERKLLVAAAEGDLGTLISMIYEVGMSPDTPLVAGITPLMIAALCGHIELVEALIQAGADVNKKNDEGMNVLDIVNEIKFYNRSDIKELIVTNTPAGELDPVNNDETTNSTGPVSNIAETTNKKTSTDTSILEIFISLMKKDYDPYYSKQKELKTPYGLTDMPYSPMTSNNMAQLVY